MKRARNKPAKAAKHDRDDAATDDRMSPTMRRLILSFVTADGQQTWDPGAYARVPSSRLR